MKIVWYEIFLIKYQVIFVVTVWTLCFWAKFVVNVVVCLSSHGELSQQENLIDFQFLKSTVHSDDTWIYQTVITLSSWLHKLKINQIFFGKLLIITLRTGNLCITNKCIHRNWVRPACTWQNKWTRRNFIFSYSNTVRNHVADISFIMKTQRQSWCAQ